MAEILKYFYFAGSLVRKSIDFIKDSEPPKLIAHKLRRDSKNKNEYFVKITASDISGLTKKAIVTLSVNSAEREIVLKLTNDDVYSKNIYINAGDSEVFIKYISLEDYTGNSKKYTIE
ncbi:MAG: hypothetical protein PF484_03775 [Bacteroidales bacterium]|nr:hypothetical protein [Bacteroidales bacterium]